MNKKQTQKGLEETVEKIKTKLGNPPDFKFRYFYHGKKKFCIIYLEIISNQDLISKNFLGSAFETDEKELTLKTLKEQYLKAGSLEEISLDEVINKIVTGMSCMLGEGEQIALSFNTAVYPKRAISEPPTSAVLKGPRDGFVEDLNTNLGQLRKRLVNPNLHFKQIFVGKQTKTRVVMAYLDNIADKNIVKSIQKKIESISIDGIMDSNYIASFLIPEKDSIFKQIGTAEKPDIAVAKILEGRIAIIVDNSPIILTLPFIFVEDLQNADDYYNNHIYSTLVRFIRIFGIAVSLFLPGIYLAFRLHHYKLLPLKFLVTINNTTIGLPFTPFVEILFLMIIFEVLYEVSLRLPSYLGLATSIVAALILGDTGVKAGLLSPPGVMMVALSVIAIYTLPDQIAQMSVLKLLITFIGGLLGLVGIIFCAVLLINEMAALEIYGSPYLAPLAPFIKSDMKDVFVKKPVQDYVERPYSISTNNRKRR